MKQKQLKRTHFYQLDLLFLLFELPPTGRNAQVQTALEISDGSLQRRLGYRSQDVSDQLLGIFDVLWICGKNLMLLKLPQILIPSSFIPYFYDSELNFLFYRSYLFKILVNYGLQFIFQKRIFRFLCKVNWRVSFIHKYTGNRPCCIVQLHAEGTGLPELCHAVDIAQ